MKKYLIHGARTTTFECVVLADSPEAASASVRALVELSEPQDNISDYTDRPFDGDSVTIDQIEEQGNE